MIPRILVKQVTRITLFVIELFPVCVVREVRVMSETFLGSDLLNVGALYCIGRLRPLPSLVSTW